MACPTSRLGPSCDNHWSQVCRPIMNEDCRIDDSADAAAKPRRVTITQPPPCWQSLVCLCCPRGLQAHRLRWYTFLEIKRQCPAKSEHRALLDQRRVVAELHQHRPAANLDAFAKELSKLRGDDSGDAVDAKTYLHLGNPTLSPWGSNVQAVGSRTRTTSAGGRRSPVGCPVCHNGLNLDRVNQQHRGSSTHRARMGSDWVGGWLSVPMSRVHVVRKIKSPRIDFTTGVSPQCKNMTHAHPLCGGCGAGHPLVSTRSVFLDWQAFDTLDVGVPTWLRLGNTLHSKRRVADFRPGDVSVKFWSTPVQIWSTESMRRHERQRKSVAEDKKYELDSDGDDAREDPATEHIEAGGGDGDDADLLRTLETELEDLFGDIDYVEDVREDEVEEAAQRLEPQLIIQT